MTSVDRSTSNETSLIQPGRESAGARAKGSSSSRQSAVAQAGPSLAVVPVPRLTLDQRLFAPLLRTRRQTVAWISAVLVVLVVHGALLAFLLYREHPSERTAAKEPTPIEVVVEQKPTMPKQPDPPKPQPQKEVEKPASSAPRAANEQKVDTAALDKETRAPKSEAPPQDGQAEPKQDAGAPADTTTPADPTDGGKPDVLQKDAEALDKAQQKEKPKRVAKAAPKAKPRKLIPALQQLAGASNLPDYRFSRPTKKAPVSGGTEDARYLAIVYGMIMHNRRPIALPGDLDGTVTVAFTVDDVGNVITIGFQRRSGYPEVDAEIVDAVRRASPFPAPPPGAPHGLVATIDFSDMKPAYTMGSQGH